MNIVSRAELNLFSSARRQHTTLGFVVVLTLTVLLAAGCDSLTDVDPKGSLSEKQLENAEGAEALVNAAYSALDANFADPNPAFLNPPSNWSFSDVRSDDAYKGGGGTGDIADIHLIEINDGITPALGIADTKWQADFIGVQRANSALRVVKNVEDESYPKQQRIAELRFLRGHFYFDLKKIFNRVPYIDETMPELEVTDVSNRELSSEELWDKIRADFQFAADNLPDQPEEQGRADRFAAEGYLAKVALFRENWSDVIDHTDTIINSGRYGLLDSYTDLSRVEAFDNGKEDVFSIQHSVNDGSNFGNINWGDLLNMPTTDACGGGGDGFLRPSQNLVNAYRVGEDGLPLLDSFNEQDVQEGSPIDPRLDFVVTRIGIPWKGFSQLPTDAWMRNSSVYGPYARKKLIVPPDSPYQVEGFPWCASSLNWPLIRYAEVLLWKAEALVESGGSLSEARNLVNQVRERAANRESWVRTLEGEELAANYQIEPYPAEGWTRDYALKAVRFETRLETALEGHRFFNLVRWDRAEPVLNEYFNEEVGDAGYLQSARFIEGQHEYMPIPQNQIDISGGIYEQNPGYGGN